MLDAWQQDLIEELKDPEFAKLYGAEGAKSEYGIALYKARQKAKMTQKDLSVKLGLSQPYIAKLESGEANPTLGTAGKILAELGLRLVIETAPLAPQPDDSSEEAIGSAKTPSRQASTPLLVREKKKKYLKD